jgi:hypothetical protein
MRRRASTRLGGRVVLGCRDHGVVGFGLGVFWHVGKW